MIAYLPELYPDELAYSWFARFGIHTGCISNAMIIRELYCHETYDDPSREFIGHLNSTAKEVINNICNIKDLILNHTMYPAYARFVPLNQKLRALNKIGNEKIDIKYLLPVTPRNKDDLFLKYCPVCAREDREHYGETYWHRQHQIRDILICPRHKCRLKDSSVYIQSQQSRLFIGAENVIPYEEYVDSIINPHQIRLAQYIVNVFNAPINFDKDIPPKTILYYQMKRWNYVNTDTNVKYMKKMMQDFNAFNVKVKAKQNESMRHIQRLLMGNLYDFSTMCKFAYFLHMTIDDLTNSAITEDQVKEEESTHYIPPNWKLYDNKMAPVVEHLAANTYHGKNNDIGKPNKVMLKLICQEAQLPLYFIQNNHLPKCKTVIEKYSESYPELWARRLVWGYQVLEKEYGEGNFYWTHLHKLTSVVKRRMDEVVPFLPRYADKELINKIMKVVYMEQN